MIEVLAVAGVLVLVLVFRERVWRTRWHRMQRLTEARLAWLDRHYRRTYAEALANLKQVAPVQIGEDMYAVQRYRNSTFKAAIVAMKQGGMSKPQRAVIIEHMAVNIVGTLDVLGVSVDVVTSAPPTPANVRRRGYDHVAELAQAVAAQLDKPYRALLSKSAGVTSQVEVRTRAARLANMRAGVLSMQAAGVVLVLDDVSTTGATLLACRAALMDAGAARVVCVALAGVAY